MLVGVLDETWGGWARRGKEGWGPTYQTGEGELGHEEVGVGLVTADFFQGEGAGAVAALLGLRDWVACYWGVSCVRTIIMDRAQGGMKSRERCHHIR